MDLRKASKRERAAAEQEAQLLSKMKHPNIVAYKESFEADDGFLYIAMGYCEGGDLYSRLKEQKGVPLEERQIVEWFVQIAMALQVSCSLTGYLLTKHWQITLCIILYSLQVGN